MEQQFENGFLISQRRYLEVQASKLGLPHLFSDSNDESTNAFFNFLGMLLICFFTTILAFFIWKKCLFEKYGAYIPLDRDIDAQQFYKRKVFMSTKTFSIFSATFFPKLEELEQNYWSIHVGVDGYLYLLFQRRFYWLTIHMSLISVSAQLILYLIEKDYSFSLFGYMNNPNEKDQVLLLELSD